MGFFISRDTTQKAGHDDRLFPWVWEREAPMTGRLLELVFTHN
jgi:hypothetical protein